MSSIHTILKYAGQLQSQIESNKALGKLEAGSIHTRERQIAVFIARRTGEGEILDALGCWAVRRCGHQAGVLNINEVCWLRKCGEVEAVAELKIIAKVAVICLVVLDKASNGTQVHPLRVLRDLALAITARHIISPDKLQATCAMARGID